MIAALYVAKDGPYMSLPGIDPWDEERNAKLYNGPWPVIAHPPCERWGKYWSGGPSAKTRRKVGDDGGCFYEALRAVRAYGGVVEHPAYSHAWKFFGLPIPKPGCGWTARDKYGGASCHVEQGNYGHPARKATWLYVVAEHFPELIWSESQGSRLEEGFHSNEERARARANGIKPLERLSKRERIHTPIEFLKVLIELTHPKTGRMSR